MDKVEVSKVPDKHSVSVAREVQAGSTKARRSCSDSSSSGECEDKVWDTRPAGQMRRNYESCGKKTRGSRKKEGHRRCSSRKLVKKAGSKRMGRWK